jgi:hypothetical protein
MIRSIQRFATELTRTPHYDCGHADAWELVERAGTTEDLLLALGHLHHPGLACDPNRRSGASPSVGPSGKHPQEPTRSVARCHESG